MFCNICLTSNTKQPYKTYCDNNHIFHTNCMKEWVKTNKDCPTCRDTIKNDDTYNLRERKLTNEMWDNVKSLKYHHINTNDDVKKYIMGLIHLFDIAKSISQKIFIIYNLFDLFTKKYHIINNDFRLYEGYRITLLKNITQSFELVSKDTIEYSKLLFMTLKMQELQLDYTYSTSVSV